MLSFRGLKIADLHSPRQTSQYFVLQPYLPKKPFAATILKHFMLKFHNQLGTGSDVSRFTVITFLLQDGVMGKRLSWANDSQSKNVCASGRC